MWSEHWWITQAESLMTFRWPDVQNGLTLHLPLFLLSITVHCGINCGRLILIYSKEELHSQRHRLSLRLHSRVNSTLARTQTTLDVLMTSQYCLRLTCAVLAYWKDNGVKKRHVTVDKSVVWIKLVWVFIASTLFSVVCCVVDDWTNCDEIALVDYNIWL